MDEHGAWSDESAAYALGALDAAEARRFEEHARDCPDCRSELSEMRAAVAMLPMSAPQLDVPKALRKRVLAEVAADARQRHSAGPRESRAPRSVAPRPRFGLSMPALSGGLAAACAAIVVAVIATNGSGTSGHVYPGSVRLAGASASLHTGSGTPELVVQHLPAPPRGKVYEVWVARGGVPQATSALFDVGHTGTATVAVPESLSRADAVMVTAEPAGGSSHPTSAPVIDVPIS